MKKYLFLLPLVLAGCTHPTVITNTPSPLAVQTDLTDVVEKEKSLQTQLSAIHPTTATGATKLASVESSVQAISQSTLSTQQAFNDFRAQSVLQAGQQSATIVSNQKTILTLQQQVKEEAWTWWIVMGVIAFFTVLGAAILVKTVIVWVAPFYPPLAPIAAILKFL